jgi:hypothetical protein
MLKEPRFGIDSKLADRLSTRIEILEKEAAQICEWLHAMTGLVDPEPIRNRPLESESKRIERRNSALECDRHSPSP